MKTHCAKLRRVVWYKLNDTAEGPDDGRSKHLWNVCKFLPDYMTPHSNRQTLSDYIYFIKMAKLLLEVDISASMEIQAWSMWLWSGVAIFVTGWWAHFHDWVYRQFMKATQDMRGYFLAYPMFPHTIVCFISSSNETDMVAPGTPVLSFRMTA
jgi:hypothetical protein